MFVEILKVISFVSGWAYVILWGLSCYPQVLLNYKLKSVAGFSLDYGIMHMSGFLIYSLYCFGGFVFPYMGTGNVYLVDLFFPTHCFLVSAANLSQVWIYDRGSQKGFDKRVLAFVV